nr:MAM and LDL-receptor class A domain-containing protein 1-like [Lytechinus pictus]
MDVSLTVNQVGVPSDNAKVIRSYSGVDLSHEWFVSQIQLSVNEDFKITFLVRSLDPTSDGSVSLDDFKIEDGPCPVPGTCDFEDGFCMWKNEVDMDDFDWILYRGLEGTGMDSGPYGDHTKGNQEGVYAITSPPGRSVQDYAILKSPEFLADSTQCLKFYTYLNYELTGRLDVQVLPSTDAVGEVVLSLEGKQGSSWKESLVTLNITGTESYVILLNASVGAVDAKANIAIDDIAFYPGECTGLTDVCHFTSGFCDWMQEDESDEFDWLVGSGNDTRYGNNEQLPDHSFGTVQGGYAYIDMRDARNQPGDRARLVSLERSSPRDAQAECLTFWYHQDSEAVSLNIYMQWFDNGTAFITDDPLWSTIGNRGYYWWFGGATLISKFPYQAVIEGKMGTGNTGGLTIDDVEFRTGPCDPKGNHSITFLVRSLDPTSDGSVSLDDFKIEDGPCPGPGTCDFEDGFCMWKNEVDMDDFDWILYRGLEGTGTDSGPYGDHTKGNQEGVYAIISPPGRSVQEYAILKSPEFLADSTQCLKFYTYLNYDLTGRLDVQVLPSTDAVGEVVLSLEGKQGSSWKESLVTLNITGTESYVILFNASVGAVDAKANIAIDDIAFYPGECTGLTDVCHFTSGFCDWMQEDGNDEFDWLVGSGDDTRYGNNEQLPDHSFGTVQGGYAYIDMRDARNQPGDRARLVSLERSSPRDAQAECLTFWYHQDAEAVSLNIYMQWFDNGTAFITDDPLWSTIGNRGDYWWFGGATLISKFPYQAVIEGKMGTGNTGGLTIDDVEFRTGPCDPKGHCNFDHDMCSWRNAADDGVDDDEIAWIRASGSTESTGTGPTNDHTRGTKEEPNLWDCTFEDGECGYTQVDDDEFDWSLKSGDTSSILTGPSFDHTLGTAQGYYMYLETSQGQSGNSARLASTFAPPGKYCISFWFHMFGQTIGSLNVYLQRNESALDLPVWTRTSSSGNSWIEAYVDVVDIYTFRVGDLC